MRSIPKNIILWIKGYPIIGDNTPSINLLLFLISIGYFTIGADLSKEIAEERNEIEIVSGLLEETIVANFSAILDYVKTGYLYNAVLPPVEFKIFKAGIELPIVRAPPEE